jgi:hypothetical protein
MNPKYIKPTERFFRARGWEPVNVTDGDGYWDEWYDYPNNISWSVISVI